MRLRVPQYYGESSTSIFCSFSTIVSVDASLEMVGVSCIVGAISTLEDIGEVRHARGYSVG